MSRRQDGDRTELDGLSLEAAVDDVADSADRETIRETLAIVSDEGTVRRAAVDDALANASKIVTTAETRAELAAGKLNDVRETAAPVSDLAPVEARLDRFETRVESVQERTTTLGEHLQGIVDDRDESGLYELAVEIRRLTATANAVQRDADDIQLELDSVEAWLETPDRRVEALTEDIDAVGESLGEIEATVETLSADGTDIGTEPAVAWAAASIQHRVAALLIADLRAELTALREWADREDTEQPSAVEPQLDELTTRRDRVGQRLADVADPAWRTRFGDRLGSFEDELEDVELPVEWADLEETIQRYRPDPDGD
ncbi:uncharacterized protein Nmlp_3739 [Natronomonas moolapensis 8.8.11]|uniref:Halo transducer protein n=1 Tax=Natronomonas moolapensis (strain DSM 18674 / CECT 7526 / JCM 14361 / 8.8.11) TaxID=268739 RepID=M1XLJ9_NATM8|nr:hypothetical protein [Natronomonas moolapensis]CCQ37853.1 uncharacterized protein Nmlp_3739 [Natronomonas moolapensis 8.8.11]